MWSRVIQSSLKATILNGPKGKPDAKALGLLDGVAIGTPARGSKPGLCWWPAGEIAQPIVIDGWKKLECRGARHRILADARTSRGTEAVVIAREQGGFTASSLHPRGWAETVVHDSDGVHHVGNGVTKDRRRIALLWRDGTPIELGRGLAHGIGGDHQVGVTVRDDSDHATLWRGSPESAVDLHPPGTTFFQSDAVATDGTQQVGIGWTRGAKTRALLWHGTADSCVDLTPASATASGATACTHGIQVGYVQHDDELDRATLWAGREVCVSLHDLVPAPYTCSVARAVAIHGDRLLIAGECMEYVDRVNRSERGVLWEARLG